MRRLAPELPGTQSGKELSMVGFRRPVPSVKGRKASMIGWADGIPVKNVMVVERSSDGGS